MDIFMDISMDIHIHGKPEFCAAIISFSQKFATFFPAYFLITREVQLLFQTTAKTNWRKKIDGQRKQQGGKCPSSPPSFSFVCLLRRFRRRLHF